MVVRPAPLYVTHTTTLVPQFGVVFSPLQDKNERNYHIFYQLLAAASDARLKKTYSFLNDMALDRSTTYHYAKWQETDADDLENFATTLESMKDLRKCLATLTPSIVCMEHSLLFLL